MHAYTSICLQEDDLEVLDNLVHHPVSAYLDGPALSQALTPLPPEFFLTVLGSGDEIPILALRLADHDEHLVVLRQHGVLYFVQAALPANFPWVEFQPVRVVSWDTDPDIDSRGGFWLRIALERNKLFNIGLDVTEPAMVEYYPGEGGHDG